MLLYSEGQFAELADRALVLDPAYLQKDIFTGQSSNPVTWLPSSFPGGKFAPDMSLVMTKVDLDEEKLITFFKALGGDNHTRGMMDWSYIINYVNNFNYTYPTEACDGVSSFRAVLVPQIPTSRLTDTQLSLDWSDSVLWPFTPFQILVQGWGRRERMLVTALTEQEDSNSRGRRTVLTLQRSAPAETRVPNDVLPLAKSPLEPGGPNATWHCPFTWYGDGTCNCECGGLDVDCLILPAAVTGCESMDAYGSLCDLDGRCCASLDTFLSVSEGCTGTGLHLRGENTLVGLQGDVAELNRLREREQVEEGCVQVWLC